MLARTAVSASSALAQGQARALLRAAARTAPRAAAAAASSSSPSAMLAQLQLQRRALSMAMGPGGGYPFLQSGPCGSSYRSSSALSISISTLVCNLHRTPPPPPPTAYEDVWPLTKANTILNVCPQGERYVVERFGKLLDIKESGWFIGETD